MQVHKKYSLKKYNTFGVEATSDYFFIVNSQEEVVEALKIIKTLTTNIFVLGGGSNLLITQDFKGAIIKINIQGIDIIKETDNYVLVRVGAGENWHKFVIWAVEKNFYGIENLALIPGEVGASPIQNIGAYGMEVKDVIKEVEAISVAKLKSNLFTNKQCKFSYRDSYFKSEAKGKYIITSVVFKLNKNKEFNISYGEIKGELEKNLSPLSIKKVSQAVISIRQRKLPNPDVLGNSGSFFKNPIVSKSKFERIKRNFPDVIAFELSDNKIKIAAGWMIEKLGWKTKKYHGVGVHKKQALVIVNYNNASGNDIMNFAKRIQIDVQENFGITLESEVNII